MTLLVALATAKSVVAELLKFVVVGTQMIFVVIGFF